MDVLRVLVVEDDYLVAEETVRALEVAGHQAIAKAYNGMEAVALANSCQPDAIVMDIQMPGMNGIEATQNIKKEVSVPVVVLTAYDGPDWVSRASSAGVDAFLAKPVEPLGLARALRIAVARHKDRLRLEREVQELQKQVEQLRAIAQAVEQGDLIPMCMFCRQVRIGDEKWVRIEAYLMAKLGASVSHGLCPSCFQTQYPKER